MTPNELIGIFEAMTTEQRNMEIVIYHEIRNTFLPLRDVEVITGPDPESKEHDTRVVLNP